MYLYGLTLGISSNMEDIIASICTNWKEEFHDRKFYRIFFYAIKLTTLSRPSRNSMLKNKPAHNCEKGSIAIACGYVINARPGPDVATVATGMPVWSIETIYEI